MSTLKTFLVAVKRRNAVLQEHVLPGTNVIRFVEGILNSQKYWIQSRDCEFC